MKARTFARIRCHSRSHANELVLRLQADGYRITPRWRAVIARTESRKDGEELPRKLQLEAVVVSGWRLRIRPRRFAHAMTRLSLPSR
jgi:hypothetical protein